MGDDRDGGGLRYNLMYYTMYKKGDTSCLCVFFFPAADDDDEDKERHGKKKRGDRPDIIEGRDVQIHEKIQREAERERETHLGAEGLSPVLHPALTNSLTNILLAGKYYADFSCHRSLLVPTGCRG